MNVLVAIDFSAVSDVVVDVGADLARRGGGGRLWLVHVAAPDPAFVGYEAGPADVRDTRAAELRREHHELHERAAALRASGLDVTPLLIQGATAEKLVAEAKRLRADLLVLGSHGRGAVTKALLGSVSEGVVRQAPCPVVIVPATLAEARARS